MQQCGWRAAHRVAAAAGEHRPGRRRGYTAAARVACTGLLDCLHAANGAFDRAIAGAAADIALQGPSEILTLRLVQTRSRHDHTWRAETALEALCSQKCLLHRMHFAIPGQA